MRIIPEKLQRRWDERKKEKAASYETIILLIETTLSEIVTSKKLKKYIEHNHGKNFSFTFLNHEKISLKVRFEEETTTLFLHYKQYEVRVEDKHIYIFNYDKANNKFENTGLLELNKILRKYFKDQTSVLKLYRSLKHLKHKINNLK